MSSHPDITGGAGPRPDITAIRHALLEAAEAAGAAVEGEDVEPEVAEDPQDTLYRIVNSPRFIPFIDKRFFEFIAMHGRPPMLGDMPAPYKYRGWMLWIVFLANHYHPAVADRWGYYLRQIAAGRLLREPIPKISFLNRSSIGPLRNHLEKIVQQLGNQFGQGERSLYVLIDWLGWALGVTEEEPKQIDEDTAEWLYRTLNIDDMLLHPYDVLGDLLQEMRGSAANWSGFFLSPHEICECMAQMVHGNDDDWEALLTKSVHEPALGTGRMLLSMSNFSLRLSGIDKDPVCALVSRINFALWVPWAAFPLPGWFFEDSITLEEGGVFHGNGLTGQIITPSPRTGPAELMLPHAPPHLISALCRRAEARREQVEAEREAFRQEQSARAHAEGSRGHATPRDPDREAQATGRRGRKSPPAGDDAQTSLFG